MRLNLRRNLRKRIDIALLLMMLSSISNAFAANSVHVIPNYSMHNYDQRIEQLYQKLAKNPPLTMASRIQVISAYFLGRPYLGGALGEGKEAPFDQDPLYRTDAFDCATYVSTVLALAEAHNLAEFRHIILKIQYRDAQPSFLNRLHFTSVDWNVENAQNHFIEDITHTFKNAKGQPVFQIAHVLINKPAWYRHMTAYNLSLLQPLTRQKEYKRLADLHHLADKVHPEESEVAYLPLTELFYADGTPNMALFRQIPSSAIIEIVRPNWDVEKSIGTRLNISHLGFAIQTQQGLIFREASTLEHRVIDISLIDYLRGYLQHSTVKGINVQNIILH